MLIGNNSNKQIFCSNTLELACLKKSDSKLSTNCTTEGAQRMYLIGESLEVEIVKA